MTNDERREAAWKIVVRLCPAHRVEAMRAGFVSGWAYALTPPPDAGPLLRLAYALVQLGEEGPLIDPLLETGRVDREAKREIERLRAQLADCRRRLKEEMELP